MPWLDIYLAALILNLNNGETEVLASGLGHLSRGKDLDAFGVGNWVGPELGCNFGENNCLTFQTLRP